MRDYLIVVMTKSEKFDGICGGMYTSEEADELIKEMKKRDVIENWHYIYRKQYFVTQRDEYFKDGR